MAAAEEDPSSRFPSSDGAGAIDSDFTPSAIGADGRVTVIVELEGDPVAVVEAEEGRELSTSEREDIADSLEDAQEVVVDAIVDAGGEVSAQMHSAYNGVQAAIPAAELDAVADLPGVVAIHPVRTYSLDNAVSVPSLDIPALWENTGYTGEAIKVGIIDTGIDYTHATFGGPGTVAAFEEAAANSTLPADPALFGPDAPRVKGGIDLVGDAYDASSSDPARRIPVPDDNPLDCQGHGSHVAGTAGGSGVNPDGTTYTGPYDESTAGREFRVGPGVAPQVDLYAIRVFGCTGSTDVTVPAIDWAVANGLDVINLSLGSSYGRGDDPSAVAAANAVGAGVVVVVSAGNSGHNPYLTGSPGSGEGVISVAATDGWSSFPGATVTVDGEAIEAINANGADVSDLGELAVVRLVDDPATPGNEALGCRESDFVAAGVVPDGGQLAVVERGECARVAKAIEGEKAGAAAVLQINSDDSLPPYEGPIFSNPDTGEEFDVTIPFLGVRSSAASAFTADAVATVEPLEITNPNFGAYAGFTSAGPRSGDGALSPNVAAPGVSIASAAVGTGSGVAISSGTSMAAPHVAGVAALSVQAHPTWSVPRIAASIVSTADPDKVVGQDLVTGGVGLVDATRAVTTQVTALGDAFRVESGWAREAALSFGFQESLLGYAGVKAVTIHNDGPKSVTYRVSTTPSAESAKAKVNVSSKSLTVGAGRSATVLLTLTAAAKDVPSSLGHGTFGFHEISGNVIFTSADSVLRVPYLLVPRSNSVVSTSTSALFTKNQNVGDAKKSITLNNLLGAIDADADVFQWGLSDPKDATRELPDDGYDVRAAGVQSFAVGDDTLLVFAINTHKRWSNAASNEYNAVIDVDQDGEPDWYVFSYDSGAVRTGFADGLPETFLADAHTGALYASGFLTQAPTDSSTLLMPVYASSLGIEGEFDYTVETYGRNGGEDVVDAWATYDPTAPALSNGQYVTVKKRGTAKFTVDVDAAGVEAQKPLGTMVVVLDNQSGAGEALLIKVK